MIPKQVFKNQKKLAILEDLYCIINSYTYKYVSGSGSAMRRQADGSLVHWLPWIQHVSATTTIN